ncbi:rod shape-determining protein MreD [Yoonia maricola]|uniref:Rod shape-determining protein MreD n=1 Tax=Yoonia maricola TaxID=420999 RepID=A0A2M8WPP0_9RHOB|nr:rod shape-determining protein MreD [Yoonia maricola]PJI92893.1 rod shape-determining protein MreD [Yoonia maricola]
MAERVDRKTWVQGAVFVGLAFVLIVVDLVPLDMRPSLWVAPDLLLAVTLAWVVRKPNYVPVLVIAFLFLMTDFLFMRPPGLWAALVVILSEMLRRQHREFRNMPLLIEWGTVAFGIVAITIVNRIVLAIVMSPQAPLGLSLIEMMVTILVYPIVLLIAHFIFGVSRTAPGEIGTKGQVL